jgi:hypothetical protein
MAAVSPGRVSYRGLIVMLGVAAAVYGWYAVNQYAALNDVNQQQLSNAGAELKEAIDIAVVNVEEFNRRWRIPSGTASVRVRQRP